MSSCSLQPTVVGSQGRKWSGETTEEGHLAFHGLLNLFSYTTQDHLPWGGISPSRLGPLLK